MEGIIAAETNKPTPSGSAAINFKFALKHIREKWKGSR